MTSGDDRLLTIGEFSRLSQISIRMLRYYDEHGVLHPTSTDPFTGYRRYSASLLDTAHRIRQLRDIGLGVGELAICAPLLGEPHAIRAVLEQQRRRLAGEASAVADRIRRVEHLIATIEESKMSIEIRHQTLPARTVAAVRDRIGSYAEEGQLWQRLMAALPAAGVQVSEAARPVAIFHDEGYVEVDPDVEVQIEVNASFTDTSQVRCVSVGEQEIATGTLLGGYEGMGAVMAALGRWVSERGHRFAGPVFNRYVVGPSQDSDPSNWITEVCVPVTRDET